MQRPQLLNVLIEKNAIGPVLSGLLQAKIMSDRKDYTGKHAKLRSLIEKYPEDFYIDSVQGNIAGVSHLPTGFRFHAPMQILPVKLRGYGDDKTNS